MARWRASGVTVPGGGGGKEGGGGHWRWFMSRQKKVEIAWTRKERKLTGVLFALDLLFISFEYRSQLERNKLKNKKGEPMMEQREEAHGTDPKTLDGANGEPTVSARSIPDQNTGHGGISRDSETGGGCRWDPML